MSYDGLLIMISLMLVCLIVVIVGCEFTENQLVKEQAITFEQEISYRQRRENELEGELKRANETVAKLERQLECKNDLPDEKDVKL